MHLSIALTLPTRHEYVRVTRRALRDYLEEAGVAASVCEDVVVAVGEACTNVVQHAFPDGEGTFEVRVELTASEVVAEVSDAGIGFEAFEHTANSSGRLAVAGRGIEIMRRLVNEVELLSPAPAGGTRIRMRRTLPSSLAS